MRGIVRALVVDDSAFVRKVMRQMLSRSPLIQVVGAARDGQEALEMVASLRPDVITLDLMMPGMDGVEFLRRQMALSPVPVVVCSITHESGVKALEALEAGAVDFVQKPTAMATDRVFEIADELIAKVRAAAYSRPPLLRAAPAPAPDRLAVSPAATGRRTTEVVVVGISTGGPQALRQMIPKWPADFPVPVVVVIHMPVGYTALYAQRLNEIAQMTVVEATHDAPVEAGRVYIAPAGRHLLLVRHADGAVRCRLNDEPASTPHRPSVDVLFTSAAEAYGPGALGVIMTGMGNDGTVGAGYVRAKGGRVLTEAESSCVVYGMPRAAVEAHVSDRAVPLNDMAATVVEML